MNKPRYSSTLNKLLSNHNVVFSEKNCDSLYSYTAFYVSELRFTPAQIPHLLLVTKFLHIKKRWD